MPTLSIVDFAHAELGVTLHPGQADALSGYYTSGRPNWLLLAGRRGGKSLLSDIIAVYEAVVPSFEGILRPGEDRYVIVTSVRQDAANQHIRQDWAPAAPYARPGAPGAGGGQGPATAIQWSGDPEPAGVGQGGAWLDGEHGDL